jgi:hypothetical protein
MIQDYLRIQVDQPVEKQGMAPSDIEGCLDIVIESGA